MLFDRACRQSYRPKNEPNHRNQPSTFAASVLLSICEGAQSKRLHGMHKSARATFGIASMAIVELRLGS